jgi:26S proteasome regulatory subunit N3
MTGFQKALTTHDALFTADDNHFLVLRLRHFVIKTALRTITLAYSRISIRDICVKLNLESEEETEYIVAKAIRDGVIEATIDHAGGFMQSRVARNVYETDEPQTQLTRRTAYLQNMYTETVRVCTLPNSGSWATADLLQLMRFPPNAHRKGESAHSPTFS